MRSRVTSIAHSAKNKLARLGEETMVELLRQWLITYPIEDSKLISDNLPSLIGKNGIRNIAKMAVTRWWPELKEEQVAQLDIWSVIAGTSSTQWVASRCIDNDGNDHLLAVDISDFVTKMRKSFKRLYDLNIHIEEDQYSTMHIARIQLHETHSEVITNTHRQFYLAIPSGHSILFHSAQNDTHSHLILQAFMSMHSPPIILQRIKRKPTTSLNELYISLGLPTVNTTGFGIWSIYSSNELLEPGPLEDPRLHPLNEVQLQQSTQVGSKEQDIKNWQQAAMLKFKGSIKGVKSRKEYDIKRRRALIYGDDDPKISQMEEVTKYDSLLPVKRVAFNYQSDNGINIQINLSGKDVFGGMHELCDKGYIDPNKVPDWLCGDYGDKSGTIKNGEFVPNQAGGLI